MRIAGVTPRESLRPESVEELASIVRELHAGGRSMAFVGGGTQLELGNRPRALDAVVHTSALDRVVDYTPEDQTITVEAGMTFAELDRVLAANGQMLPLDVPDRERSTVGGAIATNAYGRRRLRYGTAKDLIVGVTLVRPDGTRARGGGKVVKNVAGFDLPKLMVGSLGTLGAVANATFRLYPLPQATRAAIVHVGAVTQVDAVVDAAVARRLEPESVAFYGTDALVFTFVGGEAGVAAQLAALRALAAEHGLESSELTDLERESYEQRERAVHRDGEWRTTAAAPAREPAGAGTDGTERYAGVWNAGSYLAIGHTPIPTALTAVPVVYPSLGIARFAYGSSAFPNAAENGRVDWHVDELREHFRTRTYGYGRVTVTAMPDSARDTVDAWGPPPAAFPLMQALKERFDPRGLCNPGRFVGGL